MTIISLFRIATFGLLVSRISGTTVDCSASYGCEGDDITSGDVVDWLVKKNFLTSYKITEKKKDKKLCIKICIALVITVVPLLLLT